MHAQNWRELYDREVAGADARRQSAHAEAHRVFKETRTAIEIEHRQAREAALAAHEAAKVLYSQKPTDRNFEALRLAGEAYDALRLPDLSAARHALDAGIQAADMEHRRALAAIGERHRVSNSVTVAR